MKNILITGGTGLVGRAFKIGKKISTKDVDLLNSNDTVDYFKTFKPDCIVHTAAKVGGILANQNHAGQFYRENIIINNNVFEGARISGCKKVISFLSTCVFPDDAEYPLTEDKLHGGDSHSSNFAYAYAKRMIDVQSRAYKQQYGIDYVNIIPCNIYGPNDNFHLKDSHVLPALIRKCYEAKLNNTDFSIWGSGKCLREFVYSVDVADIVTRFIDSNFSGNVLITPSKEISIKDAALLIVELIDFKGNVVFDDSKPDGQYRKPSDNTVLKSIFPDITFTPFKEGVKQTIDWFIENYPDIRL